MKCYIHPDIDAVGTCTNCGKTVCSVCAMDVGGKVVCKQCAEAMAGQAAAAAAAAAPSTTPSSGEKNPIVGLITSLIIPGLGQFINGQTKKAIILLIAALVSWILGIAICVFALFGGTLGALIIVGAVLYFCACCGAVFFILAIAIHLYAAYDAYSTAKKINLGEFTKDWLS